MKCNFIIIDSLVIEKMNLSSEDFEENEFEDDFDDDIEEDDN